MLALEKKKKKKCLNFFLSGLMYTPRYQQLNKIFIIYTKLMLSKVT